jgi:hypothetical protein
MDSRHHSSSTLSPHGWAAGVASLLRRRGRRPRVVLLAAAASAMIAVSFHACHEPSTATVAMIVDRDNAICKSYAQRFARIAPPTFDPAKAARANLPAAAKYLDQVVPLMESQQHEIKSAGQPDASQDLYASVLGALGDVIHDEQAARAAAHAGDLAAFQAAYHASAADATHLSGVAQQFGLTSCLGA